MNDTPIYRDLITEAKRRTKRDSPERRRLTALDEDTRPKRTPRLYALGRAVEYTR